MALFLAAECRPFAIAAFALFGLIGIELAALLLGFSISELVEKSFDLGHEGPAHGSVQGGIAGALNWLNVGGVPFLVLVILTLGIFAASGILLQQIALMSMGPLPLVLAVPAAAGVTLPSVRASSRIVARIVPRDETYAVELADFVGRSGTVSVGPLDAGLPGQVKLKDAYGNWHAVRARAAKTADVIAVGAAVLLVDRKGPIFLAIPLPDDLGPTPSEPRNQT